MILDILLFHDHPHWISVALDVELPGVMESIGLSRREYTITPRPEVLLDDDSAQFFSNVPEQTIILVHGSHQSGYRNVGHVRRHSFVRPDLRFILSIDRAAQEKHFADRDDYVFVREHLPNGPHPTYPVSVTNCQFNLSEFIANDPRISTPSLGAYIRDYLQLRTLAVPVVIATDRVDGLRPTMDYMSLFMQELGVRTYSSERIAESELTEWDNKQVLPEHAVVVVHGNRIWKYKTIGFVRELTEKRPDLRFLVSFDSASLQSDFENDADYQFTREQLGHAVNPEYPVSIVPAHIFDLVAIVPPRDAGKTFENYMRTYVQQRLAHQQGALP